VPRGEFIVIEGPDGAGKSTQASLLAERISGGGLKVVLTREPGGTPLGEVIRSILLDRQFTEISPRTEALLHSAARAQHVADVIEPALERGEVVISDRFCDSTLAYQGGGHELSLVDLESIQTFATAGTRPDLRILLDLDAGESLSRRFADAEVVNRIDEAGLEYHQRVSDCYRQLSRIDFQKWFVVDARGDVTSLAQQIAEETKRRFPRLKDI
jgi:dTMP kinase